MTEPRRPLSIRRSLLRTQLITAGLAVAACSAAFILNDVSVFRRQLRESVSSTARILGFNLAPAIVFSDKRQAAKVLAALVSEPSIEVARVFDAQGAELASYGQAGAPVTLPEEFRGAAGDSRFEGSRYRMYYPIVRDDERVGTLFVDSTLSALEAEYRRYALIVLGVVAMCAALSLAVARLTQRAFIEPIVALLDLVRRVSRSGDYSGRVKSERGDAALEIRQLSEEFDHMLGQIQLRDEALQRSNDSLEKRVEQRATELRDAQKVIVQQSRLSALGEMAGGIAHEINNPLAIIHGRAGMLQRALKVVPPDVPALTELAGSIRETSVRISKIIKGLRTISRDGSGDPFEQVALSRIIDETFELCRERLNANGVQVRLPERIPDITLECRPTQVGQVMLNLLSNSGDAIAELEEKWIELDLRDAGEKVVITVTDSGRGIPEAIQSKLMQPFFTTKGVDKGTGLGLSISRGIAQAHGGSLELEPGHPHTRFILTLAKKQAAVQPSASEKPFTASGETG